MLHIPLLITFSTLLAQPLYSMDKETAEQKINRSLFLQKRKNFIGTTPIKETTSAITPHHNNEDSISLFITTTSESTTTDSSQSKSSHHPPSLELRRTNEKKYGRSKTVDTATATPKTNKLKAFSSSDGATPKISPRTMLTSSFKILSQAKTVPQEKINILTNAVKNYDLPTIEEYFNNPEADPNQIDQHGNTALHYAVAKTLEKINNEAMLKKIITLFLQDLRTDTSITREMDRRRASDMLSGGENPEMRALLFARATLDIRTNHEIGKILLESYLNNIPLTDDLIKQTVECIKKKIRSTETEKDKNSIDLPQDATLPDYATNEFIFNMIKHRIPNEVYNASELQKALLKEIFVKEKNIILLNVTIHINEKSISESLDSIINTIKESHNHLAKFITKPCIFEILETYYLNQEKEKNKATEFFQYYTNNNTNTANQVGL